MQSHRMSGPSCEARSAPAHLNPATAPSQTRLHIAANTITGTILGLGIAAFYIIPAAYERRFVQIAMAIIPFYRIQDNFLFHQTGDLDHDKVLHAASLIAVILIAATAIVLTILREAKKARVPHPSQSYREGWDQRTSPSRSPFLPLTILTIAITLLQTPITSFIWTHAPELAFLQFPWRLLAILASVLALAVAIALTPLKINPTKTAILTLLIATTLTYPAYQTFHQTCDPEDTVKARLALFHSNAGHRPHRRIHPHHRRQRRARPQQPTLLARTKPRRQRTGNYPNQSAHREQRQRKLQNQAQPPLTSRSHSPHPLTSSSTCVIILPGISLETASPITTRAKRPDGLIAIPIPAGLSIIDITYTSSADQTIGDYHSPSSHSPHIYQAPAEQPTTSNQQPPCIYHQHQMHSTVKTLLHSGAQLTDAALERLLPSPDTLPHSIHRAMRHSVFAGGKRLRPILCMEAARMVAGNGKIPEGAADLGAALEMLHTYSLIHDDLPALDNDDLRRGHPTCHVVFGEAIAILAGDALQTLAFQTIAQLPTPPATTVAILREISLAVGTGVGRVGDLNTRFLPA